MYQLVLCTCPDTVVANRIARCLVEEKLAACVNLIPGITSVYSWQGKVESSSEVQLVIKTTAEMFEPLSLKIKELHPYEVPEIIALNIQQGDKHYLNWISESIN